jgi:hypothetical protein
VPHLPHPPRKRQNSILTVLALLATLLAGGLFGASAAQASQGGCITAWSEGFNIGACISDQNTGTTAYSDAYVNYVPNPSSCDIHIQVWDDSNHQYSDKQVACTPGHYTGNPASPSSAATVHGYARLDLNGTHFFVGNSPSVRLRQGVAGQGGCNNYTTQGFSIGVCVNDQNTGTTAYPDIYVNSTPFPNSCSMRVQVWDNNNRQYSDGDPFPCQVGHWPGKAVSHFTDNTFLHSYVRIDDNGGAYSGPDSPHIILGGFDIPPGPDWQAHFTAGDSGDPLNVVISARSTVSFSTLFKALLALPGRYVGSTVKPWGQVYGTTTPSNPFGWPSGYCINWLTATPGPADAARHQDSSAREGGCDPTALATFGINHFRAWSQSGGAWMIAASTEYPGCGGHCVLSYDNGRDLLVSDIQSAAQNNNWSIRIDDYYRSSGGTSGGVTYSSDVKVITLG